MKKLIALLLVICMVAGLFIGCKKKAKDPATDPTATGATEATKALDATEAPDATGETDATGVVENPEGTEAPEENEGESGNKKPTAVSRPKNTKATKATKATTGKTTKATQPASTKATTGSTGSTKATVAVNSKFKGKTLQIYGLGNDKSYQDLQTMIDLESTGIYPYIERAAIVEWAELNGVTIEFLGNYDQTTIMSSINAGDRPDIIGHSDVFPGISNNGLTAAFSNAEHKQLAAIAGEEYLDMLQYGTMSHGFVRPWTGTMVCYYNVDMFKEYNVKTPKEYFLEGNWTWDTFQQVMVQMTKDVDGDSKTDTYGLPADSWHNLVNAFQMNTKGELVSVLDKPYIKDFMQMKYDAFTVKKSSITGQNRIQKNVVYPMFAMQLSDCEPYNWQHLYQEIPNGNRLEVVPIPEWRGSNGETLGTSKLTQSCWSMAASCDEREAVIDLFCYMLKCGLKYVSDYSLGAVACEYEGLKGTSDYSKKVLEALAKINNTRTKKLKNLGNTYDAAYVTKLNKYLEGRGHFVVGAYKDLEPVINYPEVIKMPPESAIPAIQGKYEASLKSYNDTFIK